MLNVGGAIWWGYALVVVMHQLSDYVTTILRYCVIDERECRNTVSNKESIEINPARKLCKGWKPISSLVTARFKEVEKAELPKSRPTEAIRFQRYVFDQQLLYLSQSTNKYSQLSVSLNRY